MILIQAHSVADEALSQGRACIADFKVSAEWRACARLQSILGSRLGGAICTETIAAQNGPTRRRLEWHSVGLATLITGNLTSLALATRSLGASKVRTAGIPAKVAPRRMGAVVLLI